MTLIEVVIGVALLAIVGIGFMTALSTAMSTGVKVEDRTTAINVARSQLEDVMLQTYTEPPAYTTVTPPNGYTITMTVTTLTTDVLQKIKVSVAGYGETLVELEGYKINVSSP